MENAVVYLKAITMENFKNVKLGSLNFENKKGEVEQKAHVLGLYGQNGSGKTALIDALELLKLAMSGLSIPSEYGNYINLDAEFSKLTYEFIVKNTQENDIYNVIYEFKFRKSNDLPVGNVTITDPAVIGVKLVVFDEMIRYSMSGSGKNVRLATLMDTKTEAIFLPMVKYYSLVGKDKIIERDLLVVKKLTEASARSFLFSGELFNVIRKNCKDKGLLFPLNALANYSNFSLFIIKTSNSGLISLNTMAISFKVEGDNDLRAIGNLMLPLVGVATIPEQALDIVKRLILNMNIVLPTMVPNLKIGVEELGAQIGQNGAKFYNVQLMSYKNGKKLPLGYEAEGIKKIISILQLLIVCYNNPSFTIAIDELDSGIFEYLLGEMLSIMAEKGKGQLIFTSHNLRPLETLETTCIAFTTVNPHNRYTRITNLKRNNNLRNVYYRDIVLENGDDILYDQTNNVDIALALKKAFNESGKAR